ncbi:hypothetical protein JG688_00007007 [Phytophthora aleatoria]|uniref:Uncharacterized protein n=1 Tax=Phytophthora aleatoria TaxID=2496075 RepID=A0A8J5IKK9_9STRA|nr:hypothetical protein JG688_00007007 [Phytophthora aleatoria]
MHQQTLVSQQQRAKKVAGSEKKRLAARKAVDCDDQDYNPEQGEEAAEFDVVDEHEDIVADPSNKRKATPTSKARCPKKAIQAKKTRKRAAAELPCGVSADAEERGAVALENARKKLEAIAATKARKRQKTTVTKATQVSPTRYDMFHAGRFNKYSRIDDARYAGTSTILQHRSSLFYTAL